MGFVRCLDVLFGRFVKRVRRTVMQTNVHWHGPRLLDEVADVHWRAEMTIDVHPYAETTYPETLGLDPVDMTRTEKIRIAARVLIKKGVAGNGGRWGLQSRLAEHFGVTRQRVSQIVRQEINAQHADPR